MPTPSILISRCCLVLCLSPNLSIGLPKCFGGMGELSGVEQRALKHRKAMFP